MKNNHCLVSLILAVGKNGQIGLNNNIPWRLSDDMAFFKDKTLNHVVIFGRKTFESIGRVLPKRTNVVITHNKEFKFDNCLVFHDIESALSYFYDENEIFICGGSEIYSYCLQNKLVNKIYMTKVNYTGPADTYFDMKLLNYWKFRKIKSIEINETNNYSAEIFVSNIKFFNDK